MNLAYNLTPMLALALAQLEVDVSKMSVYGPMGIICLWLMWRDERQMRQNAQISKGTREDNEKLREEFRGFTHQLKGLNRNMLYYVATHAGGNLGEVAKRELERSNENEKS